MSVKYNFGGGTKRVKGHISVDALDWSGYTEIIWDLTKVPYEFVEKPVDEILAMEFLEHISWREVPMVLKEWHRILKPGGKLSIQTPDIGKMCGMFTNKEICECVPNKAQKMEDFKAKPGCWACQGKAKINPIRWTIAFVGTQKHKYDRHLSIFTHEILEESLKKAGFSRLEWKDNIYKLVVNCFK